jgi:hypothetical protein
MDLIGCGSLNGGRILGAGLSFAHSVPDGLDGGEAEGEGDSECLHLQPNLWVFCKH